jgi:hypothetical protein
MHLLANFLWGSDYKFKPNTSSSKREHFLNNEKYKWPSCIQVLNIGHGIVGTTAIYKQRTRMA